MRLQKYIKNELNERYMVKDWMEVMDILRRDCGPYIKEKALGENLWRGMKKDIGDFTKITPRKNRRPKDMPWELHEALDNAFKEEFGWKARSEAVFCSSSLYDAGFYGDIYIIYPIGKIKYVYSPVIPDIYTDMKRAGFVEEVLYKNPTPNRIEQIADSYIELYTDKNLKEGMRRGVEILIKCNSYYALDFTFINPLDADKDYVKELEKI